MLIYANSCDVIEHVTSLDQSEYAPVAPPGGETALDQSESAQTFPHLSAKRGLYGGAPSGNKRTTNQNAPFQISTNQNEPQNLLIFKPSKTLIYYSCSSAKIIVVLPVWLR